MSANKPDRCATTDLGKRDKLFLESIIFKNTNSEDVTELAMTALPHWIKRAVVAEAKLAELQKGKE